VPAGIVGEAEHEQRRRVGILFRVLFSDGWGRLRSAGLGTMGDEIAHDNRHRRSGRCATGNVLARMVAKAHLIT
jgi:hypothetical protein